MPLQALQFKPGIDRENTNYVAEGGWYSCDKIRFRSGQPEKIGGWVRLGLETYQGVARTMINWVTLANENLLGFGTHLKYYVELGEALYDITPIRSSSSINNNPFSVTNGSAVAVVTDTAHGAADGDFVTFSGAGAFAGLSADDLNREFRLTLIDGDAYSVTLPTAATSTTTGGGGAVIASYQINTGLATYVQGTGWGAGGWGRGGWGSGSYISIDFQLRLWNHGQFGEDLIYGPRGGALYYWDASSGTAARGVRLDSLGGASNVPLIHNVLVVSDVSRFVLVFGTNAIGDTEVDPMLVRWSDQENAVEWTPAVTNQSGDLRLSYGSSVITARNARQEILAWTDAGLYSIQYQGLPFVFGAQLIAENLSIAGPNAVVIANNTAYWMGADKFYKYSGRVETLDCTLLRYVFEDFNATQRWQVCAGSNEGFNEVWWFYCSAESEQNDRYVVYNYLENIWYYGNMTRTAWLDSPLRGFPIAATNGSIVYHENGNDDGELINVAPSPITAYVESADFDIGDGHQFAMVWRMIPDITFVGSVSDAPDATLTLFPRRSPGSAYEVQPPTTVVRSVAVPVEQFTEQVYVRLRGRQMALRVESDALGVAWQVGKPRIDIRPDGRR